MVDEARELENVRVGYKVAVDLCTSASTQNWARFNAVLIANSILIAVIAQVLADKIVLPWPWLLPGFGVVLCVLWGAMLWRGMEYQDQYIAHARRLEEHLGPVRTVEDTGRFADGLAEVGMKGLARLRNRHALVVIMVAFGLLYLGCIYHLSARQPRLTTELRTERLVLVDSEGRTVGSLSVTRNGHILFALVDREGRLLWTAP